MTFGEWIKRAPGRASAAAVYFDVSASAISQWAGNGVPVGRMKAVREFTSGEVTLDDMVPELIGRQAAPPIPTEETQAQGAA